MNEQPSANTVLGRVILPECTLTLTSAGWTTDNPHFQQLTGTLDRILDNQATTITGVPTALMEAAKILGGTYEVPERPKFPLDDVPIAVV